MKLQIRTHLGLPLCIAALLLGLSFAPAGAGFIENRGQTDPTVLFYAPTAYGGIYLTDTGIVLDLHAPSPGPSADRPLEFAPGHAIRKACALRLHFADANPAVRIEAGEPLETRFNFLHGNDPSLWRTDVPSFGEIVYHDVRPGIDLSLRCEHGLLFYEWTGTAGAALSFPAFTYDGAVAVTMRSDGSRSVETALGAVLEVPAAATGSRGVLLPPGRALPGAEKNLTDDPSALIWSTFIGGEDSDAIQAMAMTGAGNVLIGGYTFSYDFPIVPGAYDDHMQGAYEGFIALLSYGGNSLLACTWIGGAGDESVTSIVRNAYTQVFATGYTTSTDFPTSAGAYDTTKNGGSRDAFAVKLGAGLSMLVWGTYLGGSGEDEGRAIALDSTSRPIVSGVTTSPNMPTAVGGYDETYNGGKDGFVAKLNETATTLAWCTYLGGSDDEELRAMAIDAGTDEISIVGSTASTDFPTTLHTYDRTFNGGDTDGFVARLENNGLLLNTGSYFGGSGNDEITGLNLPNRWYHVLTGTTTSSDFPTTAGAYDRSLGGSRDAFVAQMNCFNHTLTWSTYLGGSAAEYAPIVVLDDAGNPVVTGETLSHDFPTTDGAYDQTNLGSACFITRLGPVGEVVLSSTYLAGPYVMTDDQVRPCGLAVSGAEEVIVAGFDADPTFPTTSGAYDTTHNGYNDGFVSKLRLPLNSSDVIDPPGALPVFPQVLLGNLIARDEAIWLRSPAGQEVTLDVVDAAGREVSRLLCGSVPAGQLALRWTGRDQRGVPIPSGAYFLRLCADGRTSSRKVTWIR